MRTVSYLLMLGAVLAASSALAKRRTTTVPAVAMAAALAPPSIRRGPTQARPMPAPSAMIAIPTSIWLPLDCKRTGNRMIC